MDWKTIPTRFQQLKIKKPLRFYNQNSATVGVLH